MNLKRLKPAGCALLVSFALGGCHRAPPASIGPLAGPIPSIPDARIEGPAVETLSPDELQAIVRECHRYGPAEDPRVRYALDYCAAVDTAQSSLGWGAKAASVPLQSHPFH